MESAIGPCVELLKCTGGPVLDQINLLWNLRRNLNNLKDKRDELVAKESDVKSRIGLAPEEGKLVLQEVSLWLQNVERVKSEVSVTEDMFAEHKACCICSNCYARLKLAKRVVDKTREVEDLVAKQLPDPLVIDPPKPRGILLNPPPIVGGDSTREEIMKLLKDPRIGRIGVWGMGGVGKTTIMKAVNDELITNYKQEFSQIIWVTASKDNMGGVAGLQDRIAKRLGDDCFRQVSSNEDRVIRAGMLCQKLKQVGNFVLIIDDLWEKIKLRDVGIPDGDQNKGKIVVTTRELSVCDSIGADKVVEVERLPEEAAWKLFVSEAGEHILHSSDIEPLARKVLKECAGLPLAIVTVACAMKRKQSSSEWSYALNALRNSSGDDLGLNDEVFKPLRFSYDNLKEEAKSCFLYCAFYPEDHQIDNVQLIEYWIAEGYTSAGGSTSDCDREAEFNKGFYLLGELKDASLLQPCGIRSEYVKMHDLVRDLAIQIMWKDFNFISKAGTDLKEWPEKAFATAHKISLMESYVETFPDQPNCPNLSTLFLGKFYLFEQKPMTIPMLFFSKMLTLQVLRISYISMTELPKSLSDLVGLQALFLEGLKVKKIPSLAKLKELQVLSLHGSEIEETPAGMEALVNLRLLDLYETRGLENFNADLISKLTLLEELHMSSNLLDKSSGVAEACIEAIAHLKRLKNLSLSFDDAVNNYPMAVYRINWNKLKGFFIHLDDDDILSALPVITRSNYSRKVVHMSICYPENFSAIQVPSNAQELWLQGCETEDWEPKNNRNLWESQVHLQEGCFTNLKNLTIEDCPIKNLSSFITLQQLKKLELIRLLDCKLMEEIIEDPGDGCAEILLPKLHTLILRRLPRLHSMSSGMAWICDSLKVVAVFGCPKLEQLPFNNFSNSGVIYGTNKWWERLRWENPTRKTLLRSCFVAANKTNAEVRLLLQPDFYCF